MYNVADKLRPLVPEHYRPAGHPPLLRVPGALTPQLQALSAERQLEAYITFILSTKYYSSNVIKA